MIDAPVVVVKIGTGTLTDDAGDLDLNFIWALSKQLAELVREGWGVVLVTSGAIRAGLRELNLEGNRSLRYQQAAAAVGQVALMRLYADFYRGSGVTIAQVLLSRGDIADRRRYLNARNTLLTLIGQQVVPIINENDTVAVEEIQYGDNDLLAAQVVQLVGAELLVFLTDTDGLFVDTGEGPQLVPEVTEITAEMEAAAGASNSGVGTGGMTTKLQAARMATRVGAKVVITRGKPVGGPPPVRAVIAGEPLGTTFLPAPKTLTGRKRWLAQSAIVDGDLEIDDGAVTALRDRHKSLLAVGVREVRGEFEPGALVRVITAGGFEIARGLVNYSSADIGKIRGLRSWDIPATLGFDAGAEVIHRDNLAMIDDNGPGTAERENRQDD